MRPAYLIAFIIWRFISVKMNLLKLFHRCKFDNYKQCQYSEMYDLKSIIYDQYSCRCGKHKEIKICGTIELKDIPAVFLNAL